MSNTLTDDPKYGWFCSVLFNMMHSDASGVWRPCCYAKAGVDEEKTIYDTTPLDYFLSEDMHRYRKMTLAGEVPPICIKCKEYEDRNTLSYRQMKNRHHSVPALQPMVDKYMETGKLEFEGRFLRLKVKIFGNYCNLKCFMCHPINSSSRQTELMKMAKKYKYDFLGKWENQYRVEKSFETTLQYDEVIKEIESIAQHIHSLEIIGGEPLMMKSHYDLLDRLIESGESKNIDLLYVTNLTKLQHGNRNFLHYVDQFHGSKFVISLDGIEERGSWIRYGLDWNEFLENLDIMIEHGGKFDIAFTASNLSILYAIEMFEYFMFEKGLMPQMDENLVTTPKMLNPCHLPDKIKDKLIREFRAHPYSNEFDGLIETLKQPRNENLYRLGMKYIKTLNEFRGTNVSELFPELKDDIESAELDFYNDPEYYLREMG